jgi:hypothetical protein
MVAPSRYGGNQPNAECRRQDDDHENARLRHNNFVYQRYAGRDGQYRKKSCNEPPL